MGESHYFLGINRNKKSLVVDLQHDKGKEILRKLAATADIRGRELSAQASWTGSGWATTR